jgi:hypothetical protein
MLFLLRKIRRKLISPDNKALTYLLYAIGEIVLVVLGILIAVSIDDWNKQKEREVLVRSTLEQVKLDLLRSISYQQNSIMRGLRRDSLATYILLESPPPEVYRDPKARALIWLLYRKEDYFHTTVGYDKLKEMLAENSLPDSLKVEMDNYYSGFQKYALSVHEDYNSLISEYTTYARKTYPWYSELKYLSLYDTISSRHAYALANDPIIKNYLYEYQKLNHNLTHVLLFNAHLATKIYTQLAALTGQEQLPKEVTQWRKTISPEDKEMLSGTYENDLKVPAFTIYKKNDALLFQKDGRENQLHKLNENTYFNLNVGEEALVLVQNTDPVTISFSGYPSPLYRKKSNQ